MLQWLAENSQVISAVVSAGTLVVWVVYLHVFLRSYRRRNKAMILITLSGGDDYDARCLVTNMSEGPIYIYAITARLRAGGREASAPVTEIDGIENWHAPSELRLWTRQGPLESGKIRDMGPIGSLVHHVQRQRAEAPPSEELEAIEIEVAAILASDDLLVAARRCYDVEVKDGSPALRAKTIGAEQVRSRRQRHAAEAELLRQISGMH